MSDKDHQVLRFLRLSFVAMIPLRQMALVLVLLATGACARTESKPERTLEEPSLALAPSDTGVGERTTSRALGPEPVPMSVTATGQLGPGRGTLIVDIKAPAGAELTEGAPFRVSAKGMDLTFPHEINTTLDLDELPARLPLDVADGAEGPIELDLTYYYCTKGDDGSCRPERAKLSVEIDTTGAGAGGEAHLVHRPAA